MKDFILFSLFILTATFSLAGIYEYALERQDLATQESQ